MVEISPRPRVYPHGDKIISVAPMMDWTDRHCRYFHRLIAPSVLLYTEMVTTGALLFGDPDRFLRYDDAERPLALQLGGSDPADLAQCAKMGEDFGYDEINLNCGCPSDRVQSGMFGACLMKNPSLVADCIKAMQDAVSLPVTVKCRIGIDDCEELGFLTDFVGTVSKDGGCQTFIIHARKAWLQGLSPKENRDIPPLQYDVVEKIAKNFPDLTFHVNGGIKTMEDVKTLLNTHPRESGDLGANRFQLPLECDGFDGIMIGREAYQNPWFLRAIEEEFYGTENLPSAENIVQKMIPYIEDQQKRYDTPIKSITRHMTGLFQGIPGARTWRQILSTEVHKDGVTADVLNTALRDSFKFSPN